MIPQSLKLLLWHTGCCPLVCPGLWDTLLWEWNPSLLLPPMRCQCGPFCLAPCSLHLSSFLHHLHLLKDAAFSKALSMLCPKFLPIGTLLSVPKLLPPGTLLRTYLYTWSIPVLPWALAVPHEVRCLVCPVQSPQQVGFDPTWLFAHSNARFSAHSNARCVLKALVPKVTNTLTLHWTLPIPALEKHSWK